MKRKRRNGTAPLTAYETEMGALTEEELDRKCLCRGDSYFEDLYGGKSKRGNGGCENPFEQWKRDLSRKWKISEYEAEAIIRREALETQVSYEAAYESLFYRQ